MSPTSDATHAPLACTRAACTTAAMREALNDSGGISPRWLLMAAQTVKRWPHGEPPSSLLLDTQRKRLSRPGTVIFFMCSLESARSSRTQALN